MSTQNSTFSQFSGGSNQSVGWGNLPQVIRITIKDQSVQTDKEWITKMDTDIKKMSETMEKVTMAKKRLETDQL